MSRNTCVVGMGSFFAWLAFTLSGIALFAPFWYTRKTGKLLGSLQYSKGIVMQCFEPFEDNSDCEWTFKDTFDDVKEGDFDDLGENWLTVQILWILGCAAFLLNAILSFLLCCDSCKGTFCSIVLTVLVFIAAACLTISVIIFGADTGDKWDRDVGLVGGGYYDWGYYVAIVASISSCLAVLFMGFIICCTRNE